MSRLRLRSPLASFGLVAVGAGLATFAVASACSKAPDVNSSDTSSESRLIELERAVHDLKAENDAAKQALGATGNENVSVARRVAELVDKVRRLEEQVAAAPAPAAMSDGSSAASSSTPAPTGALANGAISSIAPAADGTYTPEQLDVIDKAMKAVEQKRQEQAERDRLHDVLTKADLTLTTDQENLVLKLQRDYQKKRQELFAAMGMSRRGGAMQSEADRNEIRSKLEDLQTQHENELRASLPASVAESVVGAMKQSYPGFFPRDRNSRPGMGGN